MALDKRTYNPAAGGGALARLWTGYRSARDARWLAEVHRDDGNNLSERLRQACIGIPALCRRTPTVTGETISTPNVIHVQWQKAGPRLLVELRVGMLTSDVVDNRVRLAAALGGRDVLVAEDPRSIEWVWLQILTGPDPLDDVVTPESLPPGDAGVSFGVDASGVLLAADVIEWPHMICQGTTTSGKSSGLRWLLVQLARRPDVRVVGSDPSGSLWRPWGTTRHRVTGLADVELHAAMLDDAVREMDARLRELPVTADRVTTSITVPLWVLVLEEYPGLLRAADNAGKEMGRRVRSAVARLLAESHKAGFRLVLVTQRADAALIGGFERSNLGMRVSFRADKDAIKMLHAADDAVIEAHATAEPGIALLTGPGRPLVRFRAPWISYAEYCRLIAHASQQAQR